MLLQMLQRQGLPASGGSSPSQETCQEVATCLATFSTPGVSGHGMGKAALTQMPEQDYDAGRH